MASQTTNLGLIKPAYTDAADVQDFNDNMDTIDTAIGTLNSNTPRYKKFVSVSAISFDLGANSCALGVVWNNSAAVTLWRASNALQSYGLNTTVFDAVINGNTVTITRKDGTAFGGCFVIMN